MSTTTIFHLLLILYLLVWLCCVRFSHIPADLIRDTLRNHIKSDPKKEGKPKERMIFYSIKIYPIRVCYILVLFKLEYIFPP